MKVNVVYTVSGRSTYVRPVLVDLTSFELRGADVSIFKEALVRERTSHSGDVEIVAVFERVDSLGPVAYVPVPTTREITTTIETEVLR